MPRQPFELSELAHLATLDLEGTDVALLRREIEALIGELPHHDMTAILRLLTIFHESYSDTLLARLRGYPAEDDR